MGQRYSKPPSSWLGLDDDLWLAYQVDLYVADTAASEDTSNTSKPGKRTARATPFSDNPADYADARMRVSRRVKVEADGTWAD